MNANNIQTENITNQNLQEQARQKACFENNGITATYSAEDNKLRLYCASRLDDETYQVVKENGFKWAPSQELFVAPKWTPRREDLCIALAGEITAEQSTVLERAEIKAERLDDLAMRRSQQANAFHQAASRISERFAGGQPILVGHHSERGARRDQTRMNAEMKKAVAAQNAVSYWNYKASGVEHHANRKNNVGVRSRRIKTLLAELRDRQRDINHAHICFDLWSTIDAQSDSIKREELIKYYSGAQLKTGSAAPYFNDYSLWHLLNEGKITHDEVVQKCLGFHDYQSNNPHTLRWINHILNRLAFERSELGEVLRFDGEITAIILQAFAREQGAHSPKAIKNADGWLLRSSVPLPLHISDSCELTLNAEDWRDMMQQSGYQVPVSKPKQPSILNFRANQIKGHSWGKIEVFDQIILTKAEYKAVYEDYRGVKLSECGQFKFRICKDPNARGWDAKWFAVFLSDSKIHDTPDSESIIHNAES
ncbi:MAG: DUF3560 domain-containing protein [Betaproteobacteria bacterium]|nr:DUF3560 domain-containing protein [Betaproteobacteria bacterium]